MLIPYLKSLHSNKWSLEYYAIKNVSLKSRPYLRKAYSQNTNMLPRKPKIS